MLTQLLELFQKNSNSYVKKTPHIALMNGSNHSITFNITLLSVTLYKQVLEITKLYNPHSSAV